MKLLGEVVMKSNVKHLTLGSNADYNCLYSDYLIMNNHKANITPIHKPYTPKRN